MPKFISDAEMDKMMAGQEIATPKEAMQAKPKFISDADFEKLENEAYKKQHENDGPIEKLKDPARWKAILNNTGPYSQEVVGGTPPLVAPGAAIPKIAKVAGALAKGEGLGYALGRTGLSAGQGAVMSALDTNKYDSFDDKLNQTKEGALLSGGIQLAAESIPYIGKAAGTVARKVGSNLTGVDESLIQNYSKKTDEINKLIKQSGGDMTALADQARTELSSGLQRAKSNISSKISKAFESVDPNTVVSIEPILKKLKAARNALNPNYKAAAISEIDDMINSISNEAKEGAVSLSSLYQTKQFLNEGAKSAYNKGGQIFTRASESARAAKDAANSVRDILKEVSPAISEADSQLARLHQIEGRLNKNLLTPGKPDVALFTAGSGANPRNAATLRELEKISGVPVRQKALDLATAKEFAKPSFLATDSTGKTLTRMAAGAAAGYVADGNRGAVVGGALSSPMALKAGINTVNLAKDISQKLPSFAKFTRENPAESQAIVQMIANRVRDSKELPKEADDYLKENPTILNDTKDRESDRKPSAQLKGEALWIQKGADKLGIDPDSITSKKGRQLLIEASDLPENSKKLQTIKERLEGLK